MEKYYSTKRPAITARQRYWKEPDKRRKIARKRYHDNILYYKKLQAISRERVRRQALEFYGGLPTKCACCKETQYKFLSIDHINGGGTKERKQGKGGGHFLYRRLIRLGYPSGFQVLCFNCNMAKGIYGKCPHD